MQEKYAAVKSCKKVPRAKALEGLTEFTLIAKQLNNSKISDLATVIRRNKSLTFLGFKGWVDDEGARAIAAALKINTTLEKLSFDGTRVGYSGVIALAGVIRQPTCSLRCLSLKYCLIKDNAAMFLVKALSEATCFLEELYLDCCPQITDATGEPMYQTLFENRASKMKVVGLKDTSVSEVIQRKIRLLLLPGGRTYEKKVSPACEAAAYMSSCLGPDKTALNELHGYADRIGPLCSAQAPRIKKVEPPPRKTVRGVEQYQKYAFNRTNTWDNDSADELDNEKLKENEEEEAIDFVHTKNVVLPVLLNNEQNRKRSATPSNIKMLLKLNSKLSKKMSK